MKEQTFYWSNQTRKCFNYVYFSDTYYFTISGQYTKVAFTLSKQPLHPSYLAYWPLREKIPNTWPCTTAYKNHSQWHETYFRLRLPGKMKVLCSKIPICQDLLLVFIYLILSGILHNFSTWNQKKWNQIYLIAFSTVQYVLIPFKLIYGLFIYFLNKKIHPKNTWRIYL